MNQQQRQRGPGQHPQQQPPHPQQGHGGGGGGGGAASEDATALVDINQLRAGPPQTPPPQPGGGRPPAHHQQQQSYGGGGGGANYGEDPEEATQMVDINSFRNGPPATPGPSGPPPTPQGGGNFGAQPQFGSEPASGSNSSLVIGGGGPANAEESTQFVDINNLGGGGGAAPPPNVPNHTGPPPNPGGGGGAVDHGGSYEGSIQFVDLNQLAAGNVGDTPGVATPDQSTPQQDSLLQQSYQYGNESIQQYGEYTLIFARNQAGQEVVLKRIWSEHPDSMPELLRLKLSELGQVHHPNLARMNGMFASHSGCWVELERPFGMRLTHIFQQGAQTPDQVLEWAPAIYNALNGIHKHNQIYSNLTSDAVWYDAQSGEVKLEPFDVLSFEDRGNLGPFGPPELHKGQPVPNSDHFSFGILIINALTGVPDPGQVTRIEKKKLQKAIGKLVEFEPKKRGKPEAALRALGFKGAIDDEDRFDRRIVFPMVAVAAVMLIGVGVWMQVSANQPTVIPPQVNIPEVPEGLETKANPPGELQSDERLEVISSYIYAPPEKVDTKTEKVELTEEDIDKKLAGIETSLENAKKYKNKEQDYQDALEGFATVVRAREGKLTEKELAIQKKLFEDEGLQNWRKERIKSIEKRLIEEKEFKSAMLPYRSLVLIDPNANALSFFENNANADILTVPRKGASAKPETNEEEEE